MLILALLATAVNTRHASRKASLAVATLYYQYLRDRPWYFGVPLKVANELLPDSIFESGTRELYANLAHGQSTIRDWMLQVAWVARKRLSPWLLGQGLLRNLEVAQGMESGAFLLCIAHENEDLLQRMIAAYEPRSNPDVVKRAIAAIRVRGGPLHRGLEEMIKAERDALAMAFALTLEPETIVQPRLPGL